MKPLTADEAKDALRRAAWRGDIFRGPSVHSYGSFGCDVSLAGVLDDVDKAIAEGAPVGWLEDGEAPIARAMGHHLVVGQYAYQAKPDDEPLPDPPPPDVADPSVADVASRVADAFAESGAYDVTVEKRDDATVVLTHPARSFVVTVRAEGGDGGANVVGASGTAAPLLDAWDFLVERTDYRGNGPTFSADDVRRFLRDQAGAQ